MVKPTRTQSVIDRGSGRFENDNMIWGALLSINANPATRADPETTTYARGWLARIISLSDTLAPTTLPNTLEATASDRTMRG